MITGTCGNCRFWHNHEFDHGQCRRERPNGWSCRAADWCGQWQAKAIEQEAEAAPAAEPPKRTARRGKSPSP